MARGQGRTAAVPVGSWGEREDGILDVAETLFQEHGYEAVTMAMVARAAGLSEGTLYNYFADKRDLVVRVGQRLMQASSDIFLGWLRVDEGKPTQCDYYGRQLRDWKGAAEIEQLDAASLAAYGRMCGWTLARGHARSGDRVAIAAYLGGGDSFDRAVLAFADAYAEQNQRDYQALAAAARSGRITAEAGL